MDVLHGLGRQESDLAILSTAFNTSLVEASSEMQNLSTQERTEVVRAVRQKIRAYNFDKRVLTAYGNQCAICGVQLRLVEAAHILPVAVVGSTDETSNGIALCVLHHRAYDRKLIAFDSNGPVHVNSERVSQLRHENLHGGLDKFRSDLRPFIHTPPDTRDRPNVEFVQRANQLRGWALT